MRRLAFVLMMLIGLQPLAAEVPLANIRADRVVIQKSRHLMTLYRDGTVLRSYQVALGTGGLAPKRRQYDRLTPEGRYRVDGRNANSAYHLSLHLSYPNAADIAAAEARGESPGGDIMIHGFPNGLGWLGALPHGFKDWTAGCIAIADNEIEEIWRAVPDGTPVEILP